MTAGVARMWYLVNRTFFQIWFTLQFRYRVEGREHEPPLPYVIVVNHASAADIPLVALAVRAPVAFLAKSELMTVRPVRAWIRSMGSIFVRRGEPDRLALRAALETLAGGARALAVFGEGTRSLDGRLQPFEDGAAYLALKAGVLVLPMGIIGSHRIMPSGARFLRVARVTVRLGSPLVVPKVEGRITREMLREWTARFHRAVADLLPPEQLPPADVREPGPAALPGGR